MDDTKATDDLGLWNKDLNEQSYGSKYQDHIFEQYKLYVQMADQVSSRRNLANTFFLTINTFFLGGLGLLFERGPLLVDKRTAVFVLSAGLVLCIAWWLIVRSYRQLNTGKFRVIGEFEKRLPARPYWNAEWKALGEGKDTRKYLPLTHVENSIPAILGILYIAIAVTIYFVQ